MSVVVVAGRMRHMSKEEKQNNTLSALIEKVDNVDRYTSKLDDRMENYYHRMMELFAEHDRGLRQTDNGLSALKHRMDLLEKRLRDLSLFISGVFAGAGFAGAGEGVKVLVGGDTEND